MCMYICMYVCIHSGPAAHSPEKDILTKKMHTHADGADLVRRSARNRAK